ncbi:transcription repressor NadR [Bacillus sp. Marseille-P3661]|uniref:transcription repressor NadR n=1 Tax=Bacillus sp. Marseille-P3661 TaxID=1936234 RepID=UPI000C83DE65|nr:transcription repressor NadR [Bacillus sp. Marseille-P3661]
MTESKKILGAERRKLILEWLQQEERPLTGSDLAQKTNVSRQVIVQDISLLKAKNEPIIATAQGYLYLKNQKTARPTKVVVSSHSPSATAEELYLIVDCGVTVKDVTVEHPVYGDLKASLMVSNRYDVDQFLEKLNDTNATLLSQLTDGTHLHTLEADTEEQIENAVQALAIAGFLLE